jgi:hypothetical protein
MGAKGSGSQEALGSSKPRRLSSSQSASRHRPGVRSDDRLTPPCEVTERCTRKEHVEPRRSTSLESRDIHRGGNATRRPRTFAARIRKERSSGRDHGERHFGARNPLLRGSADLRTLLARRPLLHAGLHLHDRERRGREVSAVFANEITHPQRLHRRESGDSVALLALPDRASSEGMLADDAAGSGQELRVTRL